VAKVVQNRRQLERSGFAAKICGAGASARSDLHQKSGVKVSIYLLNNVGGNDKLQNLF